MATRPQCISSESRLQSLATRTVQHDGAARYWHLSRASLFAASSTDAGPSVEHRCPPRTLLQLGCISGKPLTYPWEVCNPGDVNDERRRYVRRRCKAELRCSALESHVGRQKQEPQHRYRFDIYGGSPTVAACASP